MRTVQTSLCWLLICSFCIVCSFKAPAQGVVRTLSKADEAYQRKAYAQAIPLYEAALPKMKPTEGDPLQLRLNLANSYYYIKDFERAERYYREAFRGLSNFKGDNLKSVLRFAQTLANNGQYTDSRQWYDKYAKLAEQDTRGAEFARLYSNTEALHRNASSYRVDYLGLNTAESDFSPTYYKDGMVFVSGRSKASAFRRIFSWDSDGYLDLFLLEKLSVLAPGTAAGVSSSAATAGLPTDSRPLGSDHYTPLTSNDSRKPQAPTSVYGQHWDNYVEEPTIETTPFSKKLNTKYHEGPAVFYHNYERVVFTRTSPPKVSGWFNQKKDESNRRLQLFLAEKTGGDWGNVQAFPYNNEAYSCGHPSISANEKCLYFVSDMPGGYGGTDVYVCHWKDGKWGTPENLGGHVNSQGNELFPFVDSSGVLYFASDGHPGLGGLDIFRAETDTATGLPLPKRIRNLGAPLNSNQDDFGLIADAAFKKGFFSSNRKRSGLDDDIYSFERFGPMFGCREAVVSVIDSLTRKPLPNIPFSYAVRSDSSRQEMGTTNAQGVIKLCFPADEVFSFRLKVPGYQHLRKTFSTNELSDYEPAKWQIVIAPVTEKPVEKPAKVVVSGEERLIRRETPLKQIFRGVVTRGNDGEPLGGVIIQFKNLCSGITETLITKADGEYEFKRDTNCDYELMASGDGYAASKELINRIETHRSISIFRRRKPKANIPNFTGSLFDTRLYKVGDVVKLDNIYYELDEYTLSVKAKTELDRLVRLLSRYPNMIVEVRSHTDTRGNAVQNQQLSQRRADEVIRYLVKNGIERRRLKGVGMGEAASLNQCGDGVQCTEAEHQRNRRTEFKIIQIEKMF